MNSSNTLLKPFELSGVGMHSGATITLRFEPSHQPGIRFIVNDASPIMANLSHYCTTNRATILGHESAQLSTPEHLLAACYGIGLTDCTIYCSGPEIPIMDGSALPFIEGIESVGMTPNPQLPQDPLVITQPLSAHHKDGVIMAVPAPHFRISYFLDLSDTFIGEQTVDYVHENPLLFKSHVAPARTWCRLEEVEQLRAQNLGLGGSLDNALVIGDLDYLNPTRMNNECAMHKLLDVMGDLSLIGRPIQGHIIGVRSGHHLNLEMAKLLASLKN